MQSIFYTSELTPHKLSSNITPLLTSSTTHLKIHNNANDKVTIINILNLLTTSYPNVKYITIINLYEDLSIIKLVYNFLRKNTNIKWLTIKKTERAHTLDFNYNNTPHGKFIHLNLLGYYVHSHNHLKFINRVLSSTIINCVSLVVKYEEITHNQTIELVNSIKSSNLTKFHFGCPQIENKSIELIINNISLTNITNFGLIYTQLNNELLAKISEINLTKLTLSGSLAKCTELVFNPNLISLNIRDNNIKVMPPNNLQKLNIHDYNLSDKENYDIFMANQHLQILKINASFTYLLSNREQIYKMLDKITFILLSECPLSKKITEVTTRNINNQKAKHASLFQLATKILTNENNTEVNITLV